MNNTLQGINSIHEIVSLHEANIRKYKAALSGSPPVEGDIRSIFERILEESLSCRNQLIGRDENAMAAIKVPAQKNGFTPDRKSILLDCLHDVQRVLNFYRLVLSSDIGDENIRTTLIEQRDVVTKLYAHIKQFHDAQ